MAKFKYFVPKCLRNPQAACILPLSLTLSAPRNQPSKLRCGDIVSSGAYSYRSATIGSTDEARRAGIALASSVIRAIPAQGSHE